jgi:Cu/Ag efflux pump CusA
LETSVPAFLAIVTSFGGVQEVQTQKLCLSGRLFILALLLIYTILCFPIPVFMTAHRCDDYHPLLPLTAWSWDFWLQPSFLAEHPDIGGALAGVVVNNAIILIDFFNQEKDKGVDRWHAIINSGSVRLRPIILTNRTTVAGMLPLVFSSDPPPKHGVPWQLASPLACSLPACSPCSLFR